MQTRKLVSVLMATSLFAVVSGAAQAALIGINFSEGGDQSLAPGDVAGIPGFTQPNWNNMVGATQGAAQPLLSDTGVTTGALVTWTSNNTWRIGGTPANPDSTLMKGYLDTTDTSVTSITISEVPFSNYDVRVYYDGGGTNRWGRYTVQTASSTVTKDPLRDDATWPIGGTGTYVEAPNSGDSGNYSVFSGFSDSSVTILATSNGTGGGFRAPINAIQIVGGALAPAPIPNPIGYWNFDDVGSTAIDASGNPAIAIGDIQGAPHVAGKFGGALDFNPAGSNQVVIARANEALASLGDTEEVTVAFWQYGDAAAQPRSDTIFSAKNIGGGRVLQSHLPWGNSNVYWDAGNSYDRINAGAGTADFEGSWQHWAFTKNNATGIMNIYHNGALWLSGGGRTLSLDGIVALAIGSEINGNYYDGMIDDFAIWNTELSPGAISRIAASPNALTFSPGAVRGGDLRNDAGRLSPGGDGAIGTTVIGPEVTNIGPTGTATQASISSGGDPARGIDGNTDGNWGGGSVTHTANSSPSWWQVDLLAEQIIDDIVLWNRTDCCANRLSNFRVSVLDAAENEVWGEDFFETTGYAPREFGVGVPDGIVGQFVRVDKLGLARDGSWITSLAEVEVLSPSAPTDYFQGDDGILTLEIGPLAATFDRLIVTGDVFLDGTLDVRGLGLGPGGISVLDVLDWGGTLSGEFDDILVPDWDPASGVGYYEWDFSGFYTTGTIVLIHIPEPATFALLGLGALALRRRRRR